MCFLECPLLIRAYIAGKGSIIQDVGQRTRPVPFTSPPTLDLSRTFFRTVMITECSSRRQQHLHPRRPPPRRLVVLLRPRTAISAIRIHPSESTSTCTTLQAQIHLHSCLFLAHACRGLRCQHDARMTACQTGSFLSLWLFEAACLQLVYTHVPCLLQLGHLSINTPCKCRSLPSVSQNHCFKYMHPPLRLTSL